MEDIINYQKCNSKCKRLNNDKYQNQVSISAEG